MRRLRTITPVKPAEIARHDGLAYAMWLPDRTPVRGGVVILHGAGSCKESHYDYARALLPVGLASISFDQRGHGESDGPMDARALSDVISIAGLLRERARDVPIALRGSSMGALFALMATAPAGANSVVAICPPGPGAMSRGIRRGPLMFDADTGALAGLLAEQPELHDTLDSLQVPVLLMHAEGDEVIPVEHSRELEPHLQHPSSRLVTVPGGHHRSIQHDEELQAVSIRFLEQALAS